MGEEEEGCDWGRGRGRVSLGEGWCRCSGGSEETPSSMAAAVADTTLLLSHNKWSWDRDRLGFGGWPLSWFSMEVVVGEGVWLSLLSLVVVAVVVVRVEWLLIGPSFTCDDEEEEEEDDVTCGGGGDAGREECGC